VRSGFFTFEDAILFNLSLVVPSSKSGDVDVEGLDDIDTPYPLGFPKQGFAVYKCRIPRACLGGSSSRCAVGYRSALCGVCDSDYYRSGSGCSQCPSLALTIAWTLIVVIIMFLIIRMLFRADTRASFFLTKWKIFLAYSVVVSKLGSNFSFLDWPPLLLEIFQVFELFNLDIVGTAVRSVTCYGVPAAQVTPAIAIISVTLPICVTLAIFLYTRHHHARAVLRPKAVSSATTEEGGMDQKSRAAADMSELGDAGQADAACPAQSQPRKSSRKTSVVDASGQVDAELLAAARCYKPDSVVQGQIQRTFDLFDDDFNGTLELNELSRALKFMGFESFSPEHVQHVMETLNEKTALNLEQFGALVVMKLFTESNGDETQYAGMLFVDGSELELCTRRATIQSKGWKNALLVLYMLVPSISASVISLFLCDPSAVQTHASEGADPSLFSSLGGHSYLRQDYSRKCDTQEHTSLMIVGAVGVVVYPFGVPVLFMAMLYRNRNFLHNTRVFDRLGFLYGEYVFDRALMPYH
jgi:hypothetical protein